MNDAARPSAESLSILQSLAEGRDPLTGLPLPDESCCRRAEVVRALLAGIHALAKEAAPAPEENFDADVTALMAKYRQNREAIATRLLGLEKGK